jgi:hypothetical protein
MTPSLVSRADDRFDAVEKQSVTRMIAPAAGEAARGRRAHEIAVQPFDDAAGEGAGLGFRARQSAIVHVCRHPPGQSCHLCDRRARIQSHQKSLSRFGASAV